MRTFALVVLLTIATPAGAQTQTPAQNSQAPAQQAPGGKGIPPCPSFDEQRKALGQKTGSGTEQAAAQPGERSGILPSAGGTGLNTSAAPTVGSQGQAVRSPLDCPLVPGHPNAVTPGSAQLPEISKKP